MTDRKELLTEALYLALVEPNEVMTRALCDLAAKIADGMTDKEVDACKKEASDIYKEFMETLAKERTETVH